MLSQAEEDFEAASECSGDDHVILDDLIFSHLGSLHYRLLVRRDENVLRGHRGRIVHAGGLMQLDSRGRLKVLLTRIQVRVNAELSTLRCLELLDRAVLTSSSKSALLRIFHDHGHSRVFAVEEPFEPASCVLAQIVEDRRSLVLVGSAVGELRRRYHVVDWLLGWSSFNHERVPAMLGHELPAKVLAKGNLAPWAQPSHAFLLFTITQGLQTDVAWALHPLRQDLL